MHPKGGAKQGRENRSWNKDESVAYFFEATTRRNYCKKLQKTHSYLHETTASNSFTSEKSSRSLRASGANSPLGTPALLQDAISVKAAQTVR
jgi:hypothetical protein